MPLIMSIYFYSTVFLFRAVKEEELEVHFSNELYFTNSSFKVKMTYLCVLVSSLSPLSVNASIKCQICIFN